MGLAIESGWAKPEVRRAEAGGLTRSSQKCGQSEQRILEAGPDRIRQRGALRFGGVSEICVASRVVDWGFLLTKAVFLPV